MTLPISRRDYLVFFLILILSSWIRLHRLAELMPFISDQGRDFLAAQHIIDTGQIPLLGIPSSVPRFHQGPLFIWFTSFCLLIGQSDPFVVALMAAGMGVLAVGVAYLLVQKYFSTQIAVVSALILATAPHAVIQSRFAYHTNPIPLVSAFYIWSLYHALAKPQHIFISVFLFALLFQFELVTAPLFFLIPFTLYLSSQRPNLITILKSILALIIGLLPQIMYDLTHNFQQLGLFTVWIGYRMLGFIGIYQEHATSYAKISSVLITTFGYFQRFFSWYTALPTLLILTLIIVGLKSLRPFKKHPQTTLLYAWIIGMVLSFIILGNASEAYFPVLFVPLAILTAYQLQNLSSQVLMRLAASFLFLIGLSNIYFLIRNDFNMNTGNLTYYNPFPTYGPPLSHQLQAVTIIKSFNSLINLKSTDSNAHFPSYLDNYRYLLSWRGVELNTNGLPVWINHSSQPIIQNSSTYHIGTISITIPLDHQL